MGRNRPQPRDPVFAALAAQAKVGPSLSDGWKVAYFRRHKDDDPSESVPGKEYLTGEVPLAVRSHMSVVLATVAAAPPTKFCGGGYWEAMKGQLTGYHEVRKKHRGSHYRLFCRLDTEGLIKDMEPIGPLLTVICGLTKADGTTFDARDYDGVLELGEEYLKRQPRSVLL